MAERNARFWVWHGEGWVKLTLRPDQQLGCERFRHTDEGYSRQCQTWRHDGDVVAMWWEDEGRDCDGALCQMGDCFCPLDRLSAAEGHDGTPIPQWERISSEQRDQYAEMAGY